MNVLKPGLAALALTALGGCVMHPRHHTDAASSAWENHAKCEEHRQVMAGRSPAERREAAERWTKSMTPEMRQQMLELDQRCQ